MEVHKVLTEEEIDALLIERHGPENHRKMKHATLQSRGLEGLVLISR